MSGIVSRDQLMSYRDRPVHVVGVSGTEGAAMTVLLTRLGFSELTLHDLADERGFRASFTTTHSAIPAEQRKALFAEVKASPAEWRLGSEYLRGIDSADLVVVPQSWRLHDVNAPLRELEAADRPLLTLTQTFFLLYPGRTCAVTGTKGKSTTSNLLDRILTDSGVSHRFSGNDRRSQQAIDALLDPGSVDVLLLEVSNRQLITLVASPDVAVLTNLFEDHLEEHGGFDGYIAAKRRLFEHQRPDQIAILPHDDARGREFASATKARVRWFSIAEELAEGACLVGDRLVVREGGAETELARTGELRLPGAHNAANMLAGALAARALGIGFDVIRAAMLGFGGLHGRLEKVGSFGSTDFYNDVNSTIPAASEAAVAAFGTRRIVAIVGGDTKGPSYDGLVAALGAHARAIVLLPGTASEIVREGLASAADASAGHPAVFDAGSLPDALDVALKAAHDGDVILVSPAGEGFFSRYIRPLNRSMGQVFEDAVGRLDTLE